MKATKSTDWKANPLSLKPECQQEHPRKDNAEA